MAKIDLPKFINQQILLITTNPHLKSPDGKNTIKYDFSYALKLSPTAKSSKIYQYNEYADQFASNGGDLPDDILAPDQDTKMVLTVENVNCKAPNICWIWMESEDGSMVRSPVDRVLKEYENPVTGIMTQDIRFKGVNGAYLNGEIQLEIDGIFSNMLDVDNKPCHMIDRSQDSFVLASQSNNDSSPCKQ